MNSVAEGQAMSREPLEFRGVAARVEGTRVTKSRSRCALYGKTIMPGIGGTPPPPSMALWT